MLERIFFEIEGEEAEEIMDFGSMLFFAGLLGALLSVVLFLICVYVL